LDSFFAGLGQRTSVKPRRMVAALIDLLEAQIRDDAAELGARPAADDDRANRGASGKGDDAKAAASARLLRELCAAVSRRLSQLDSRTRAYPVALVIYADQSRVTAHAQRDIEAA